MKRTLTGALLAGALLAVVLAAAGLAAARPPATTEPAAAGATAATTLASTGLGSTAAGYELPGPLDASRLSWRRAFDGLHEKMVREYAFTAWKGIDWESLYAEYQPRIARAQAAGDADAYYPVSYTHLTLPTIYSV